MNLNMSFYLNLAKIRYPPEPEPTESQVERASNNSNTIDLDMSPESPQVIY